MRTPEVTIVCPVYNDEYFVRQSIDSVLAQTFGSFELVILDNGSTDGSSDIINSYSDERIRVLRSAINLRSELSARLMMSAESEYVCQIYSDDVFVPRRLEMMLDEIKSKERSVCFSNNYFINDEGVTIPPDQVPPTHFAGDISLMSRWQHLRHFLFQGNSLHPVSMLARTDFYKGLGGVKPYLHQIGDMELFSRILLRECPVFMPQVLQGIRIRSKGRRNESALGDEVVRRLAAERVAVLKVFSSPSGIEIIDQALMPDLAGVTILPALRKWFFAQVLMKIGEPEFRFMSIQLMYEALDEDYITIGDYMASTNGSTIGEYMWDVSAKVLSGEQLLNLSTSARLAGYVRVVDDLNARLESLTQDYSRADRDFNLKQEESAAFATALAEAQAQLAALTEERNALQNEGETLKSLLASANSRLEDLEPNGARDEPAGEAGL